MNTPSATTASTISSVLGKLRVTNEVAMGTAPETTNQPPMTSV